MQRSRRDLSVGFACGVEGGNESGIVSPAMMCANMESEAQGRMPLII
jgi:hypothetical protein